MKNDNELKLEAKIRRDLIEGDVCTPFRDTRYKEGEESMEEFLKRAKKGLLTKDEATRLRKGDMSLLNDILRANEDYIEEPEFDSDILKELMDGKLKAELISLKKELAQKRPSEIMERAYELTCKEEIIDSLFYQDLDDKEMKAIIKTEDVLQEFYKDWLDTDVALNDVMEDSVTDTIIFLTRHQNMNETKKNKDEDYEK